MPNFWERKKNEEEITSIKPKDERKDERKDEKKDERKDERKDIFTQPTTDPQLAKLKIKDKEYSVDTAIRLFENLPDFGNSNVIVEVVKRTLESANISIVEIMSDADEKEKDITDKITKLKSEVEKLIKEIGGRKEEVTKLQNELRRVRNVKDKLTPKKKTTQPTDGTKPPEKEEETLPPQTDQTNQVDQNTNFQIPDTPENPTT
jgi:hypothetical protein